MMKFRRKNKKGYSILEMLVTMAIFAVIIVLLLQSLLLNIKLNAQINARSRFNSDIDQLVSLIERDIRNADYLYDNDVDANIKGCNNLQDISDCTMKLGTTYVKWIKNGDTVERYRWESAYDTTPNLTSSTLLEVTTFEFFVNSIESAGTFNRANILVTILAQPSNPIWITDYGISEQVRQISVSNRNYEIKL